MDSQGKRLAELKKEVTRRGFDRHASVLQDVSDLPAELQSAAVTTLATRTSIQDIIVFPPQIQRGWHYVPKQALLFTPSQMIHLLASIWPGQEPEITCIERRGLMYMRVSLLLLYGFLEIATQGQTSPTRLSIEFNTVAWYSLSRPLRQWLQKTRDAPSVPEEKPIDSTALQLFIDELPLKFSNGLKIYGLLPGEELEELVFQHAVWKRRLYVFRQPILANTLLLLTTHYMVVIQEELGVEQGWIVSYVPRNCITAIQLQTCGMWNELSCRLIRSHQAIDFNLMLKSETAEAWRGKWIQHGGR